MQETYHLFFSILWSNSNLSKFQQVISLDAKDVPRELVLCRASRPSNPTITNVAEGLLLWHGWSALSSEFLVFDIDVISFFYYKFAQNQERTNWIYKISKTKTSFVRHCSKWSYWWNMSFWFFQLQRDMSQVDTSLKQFYEILMNSDAAHKYVNFTGKKTASLSNLATSWFSGGGKIFSMDEKHLRREARGHEYRGAWTSPSSNPG